jgi:hypothetical protein
VRLRVTRLGFEFQHCCRYPHCASLLGILPRCPKNKWFSSMAKKRVALPASAVEATSFAGRERCFQQAFASPPLKYSFACRIRKYSICE